MVESIRLSEVSAQATAALAAFNAEKLEQLVAQLTEVSQNHTGIEQEPVEALTASQRVFEGLLTATRQNMELLQRLQDRKVKPEWAR